MSKPTKKMRVPKLRFPEFRDKGEWEEKCLEEIGKLFSGLSGKSSENFGKGAPFVTYKQVFDSSVINLAKCGFVQVLSGEKQNLVKYGDVLFTASSETPNEVGFASVVLTDIKELYLNSFCFGLRMHSKKTFLPEFARYFFHSQSYRKSVQLLAQGITRFNISKKNFIKLKLLVPYYSGEQKKIADCLSSLDDLISAQTEKIEALKNHKKGLMQQLFPEEGKTLPQLRFPEFRDKGEWTLGPLGQYLTRHPEYGINAPAVPYSDKLPTYLRITDISENGDFLDDQKVSVAKEVNYENYLKEGDIVLARTGASVGKSYKYKTIDGKLVFAGFLIRVQPNEDKLNSELLFQFLSTEQYWHWVTFSSARSGQPGINSNQYASLPVPLPPDIKEQQKIANCLSSLDNLISAQAEKIKTLKDHKKGLMQQLFPVMDENSA